jgi:hypothetical protein
MPETIKNESPTASYMSKMRGSSTPYPSHVHDFRTIAINNSSIEVSKILTFGLPSGFPCGLVAPPPN